MVNNDRIVPITKTDYLSIIGTMLALASVSFGVVEASDVDGDFSIAGTGAVGNKLANQPVKSLDFASGVTSGVVYFVADYNFDTITIGGAAVTLADGSIALDKIKKDAVTLYSASLATGAVTIAAVTPLI